MVCWDSDLGFQFEKPSNSETTQTSETFQHCNAKKKIAISEDAVAV